ncbi:unnamed protein product [Protopolystoma xenopodis]|uniref:Uncharacterized protein n=1 Tax=Protopolystoma xenopodis TaxID=117903 RepID=A0A3S5A8A6_9PLAT|nr:unnamed protein product [Protopolystoma xenopodis]
MLHSLDLGTADRYCWDPSTLALGVSVRPLTRPVPSRPLPLHLVRTARRHVSGLPVRLPAVGVKHTRRFSPHRFRWSVRRPSVRPLTATDAWLTSPRRGQCSAHAPLRQGSKRRVVLCCVVLCCDVSPLPSDQAMLCHYDQTLRRPCSRGAIRSAPVTTSLLASIAPSAIAFTLLKPCVMIEVRRLGTILLGLAIGFLIVGLATSSWKCGNLFQRYCTNESGIVAVLALLLVGLVCLVVVFILDMIAHCSDIYFANPSYTTARFIILYIGAGAVVIAILIYASSLTSSWSYFMATVGMVFAVQVAILAILGSRCVTLHTERVIVRTTR